MNRRELIKATAGLSVSALATASATSAAGSAAAMQQVEQWGVFEARFRGPSTGNPFVDVQLHATFVQGNRNVEVAGFYDGDGMYAVRYMPDAPGAWAFTTISNAPELHGKTGAFEVAAASMGNHGPVQVAHRYHFAHVDGTPYFPFGTTCYSLGFIGEPFEQQAFEGLATAGFNKVRLCLLPKPLGQLEPTAMPYLRVAGSPIRDPNALNDGDTSLQRFDTERFDPAYFRHFEQVVQKLGALSIQADVILFHPYDAWGFRSMSAAANELYLRYAIARLSAYRNVWWSVANEYDLVKSKALADWDSYFRIIAESDPSSHLRSIHHSRVQYDNSKPLVTHASLQERDFEKSALYRKSWGKPVIFDEIQYEGTFARRWGNLSAEEMTRRFWLAVVHGSYATHGETFITPPGEPVWSDAGQLRGSSAPRIRFLHQLLERITKTGLAEYEDAYYPSAGKEGELYLYYFDYHCPGEYDFPLPSDARFRASLIDPYKMTIDRIEGTFTGKAGGSNRLQLPGKPYLAVLFEREG